MGLLIYSFIYLDELVETENSSIGVRLMLLTILSPQQSISTAKSIIAQTQDNPNARATTEMVSTIVIYKFNHLSRTEVEAMLGIELQQTRVYQEAKAEGRQAEGSVVVLKFLRRRFDALPDELSAEMTALSIEQIEQLAEELWDFAELTDLTSWLAENKLE